MVVVGPKSTMTTAFPDNQPWRKLNRCLSYRMDAMLPPSKCIVFAWRRLEEARDFCRPIEHLLSRRQRKSLNPQGKPTTVISCVTTASIISRIVHRAKSLRVIRIGGWLSTPPWCSRSHRGCDVVRRFQAVYRFTHQSTLRSSKYVRTWRCTKNRAKTSDYINAEMHLVGSLVFEPI